MPRWLITHRKRMIVTIGDRVRALRKEQKMTQADLAAQSEFDLYPDWPLRTAEVSAFR